jgi:hypothetical protein
MRLLTYSRFVPGTLPLVAVAAVIIAESGVTSLDMIESPLTPEALATWTDEEVRTAWVSSDWSLGHANGAGRDGAAKSRLCIYVR